MIFGLVKVFTNTEILSSKHDMSVDPISSTLPSNSFVMNVLNFNKDYNPDNPRGAWEYFKNGQPLRVRYGTTVNGEMEWGGQRISVPERRAYGARERSYVPSK